MGGDFNYVHLGGDEYSIVLTVYRDCSPANTNGTGFDAFAAVGMWDGTGTIGPEDVITMTLSQTNVSTVPVEMGNPCGTPPPELCIEKAVYTTTVELPRIPTAGIWYQRCCRNPTIVNLDNFGGGENAGMSLEVHIPGTDITTAQQQPSVSGIAARGLVQRLAICVGPQRRGSRRRRLGVLALSLPNKEATPTTPAQSAHHAPVRRRPVCGRFLLGQPHDGGSVVEHRPQHRRTHLHPHHAWPIRHRHLCGGVQRWRLVEHGSRDFQFNVTTCEPTEIVLEADAVPFAAGGLVNLGAVRRRLGTCLPCSNTPMARRSPWRRGWPTTTWP